MNQKSKRKLGMITDVGKVRPVDEDSILAADLSFGINSENSNFLLLAVADGMGGHAKGEEASKIALNTITKTVIPQLNENIPYTDLLDQGIKNANQAILDYTIEHPETAGMGTTSVCAVVKDNDVHLVNLGDSRAYVISNDEIRRVTKDHSLVQQLVDQGLITEEEARTHPQSNQISKAIGINPNIESDTMRLKLASDENLLLCCDGVIAHLTDEDIHKTIIESPDPDTACQNIVNLANERGGSDNISLIILSPEDNCDAKKIETESSTDDEKTAIIK
tara:strand:- start:77 stop:910 length:834 start_codon:yes stop_codon:yes gene_type:complete